MKLLIAILLGAAALIAYAIIEKRVSQRVCAACGCRVSADAADQPCPRCVASVNESDTEPRRAAHRA
ncbi:MAG TPA: hypothetical protein VJZ91_10055 [Blastocatellia bacterium]|nr:hypothetical protein [Blastocatellia bacterium]